mgnify:FL=1|nr:ATP-binding protein [uncultured Prevotella sp.]
MTKDLIKYLISYYQEFVSQISFEKREYELEANANYVFVGLRRAGKSYLMYQHIHHLMEQGHSIEEMLYFNFEDDRIDSITISDLDLIKTCYEEMYDHRPIFFLDEIQNIKGWEKFARRLADTGYRVYITGSNAKMLSSEIATTLGGRYLIKDIYPFSFSEYLLYKKIDLSDKNARFKFRTAITKEYEEYFRNGGLPETLQMADKRAWISSLFNKIFFGDLVTRHQVRNDFALRIMIRKLAESVKQPTSYNRIASIASTVGKKISVDTVIDYMGYLQESWLILSYENIAAKLIDKESNRKYYFIDNGILNLFLLDPATSLLENQVAIRLRQKYGSQVYFYNKNVEVDFVVYDEGIAIQVSYSLSDPETEKREVDALLKLNKVLPMRKFMIISKDEERDITVNDVTIQVIPVWKWLLD